MAERVLVLGGARSGKSALAESLVAEAAGRGAAVRYVATGGAHDAELAERVAAHQARRPAHWTTVETCDLVTALAQAPAGSAVLVDALGPWLAERMSAHGLWAAAGSSLAPLGVEGRRAAAAVVAEAQRFWDAAARHRGGPVVLVADESGLGITPPDPSARRWLDLAGSVVQRLSADADRVLLAVAGRALELPAAPAAPAPALVLASAPGAAVRVHGAHAAPEAHSAPAAGAGLGAHGDRMVPPGALDFAVNVHGHGPPAHLCAALQAAAAELGRYPDPTDASAAAAARHGRDPAEVLVLAGAAEAFRLLPAALPVRRAAILSPTFTEPEAALRAAGVEVVHVRRDPADGWQVEPSAVPADADLVVVGNPNNPTGTLTDPDRLAALCRPGRVTLVDEAFVDFVADPGASLAARADLPGLVVVRSITKLWAVPGLRAGYLLGPPDLVARLGARRQPWPVGALGLAALRVCCADEAYRLRVAGEVTDRREQLAGRLAALPGVRVWPSAANFLLLAVPDGPGVDAALRARGIAVRPSTFPQLSADHLRVAVRDGAANALLVDALAEVLHALAPAEPTPR